MDDAVERNSLQASSCIYSEGLWRITKSTVNLSSPKSRIRNLGPLEYEGSIATYLAAPLDKNVVETS